MCLAVACMGHSDTGCCYLFYNIVKILLCEPRVSTSSSLVNGAELLQDKEAFPSPPPVPCSCRAKVACAVFAALCGALARAGSLLLPGGISGTQLGPARPGSHPHPPSLVSLGGGGL